MHLLRYTKYLEEIRKKAARGPLGEARTRALSSGWFWLCLTAIAGLILLYWPALDGRFVFDDTSLPFVQMRHAALSSWLAGVRPVLMFSYWLNYQVSGSDPVTYHLLNLAIHCLNAALVFLVIRRIVMMAGWVEPRARVAAFLGAVVFAIHPLQTESVSYVAGRSESLASMFLLLAYVLFLYRRRPSISWMEAIAVLTLFALAVKTKENAVSLAPLLVLTDLFWPVPFSFEGIRRNWRLYLLMIPGAAFATVAIFRLLATAHTAGFSVATFKWYEYAFTEARAIFSYVRMAILPLDQSLDHDFATSHTIFERGAIVYMLLLAVILTWALIARKRYPLFCFGLLLFLACLAPTSSIIPLDDALVERRMYLALIGLILMACEGALRWRIHPQVLGAVLCIFGLVFAGLCFERNRLWGKPEKLLEYAAATAVHNPRPLLNFTEVLIQQNRCDLAPEYLERAERRLGNNYYVDVAWGRTLACLGRFDLAIQRFQAAARLQSSSQVYEWMGLAYAKMGLSQEAAAPLRKAIELDPNSETAHGSLALYYEKTNDLDDAEREYRRAMALDSDDEWAREGWKRVRAEKRAGTPNFSQSSFQD